MKSNGNMGEFMKVVLWVMVMVGCVVVVGLLENPSDHDDGDLWDTEYARGWYASEGMVSGGSAK